MIDAVKDTQSITPDWSIPQELIDGVMLKEVRNVPKENGVLTEIFRAEWDLGDPAVDQIFQMSLVPGAISAWHMHRETTDRLFVTQGQMKIVLYDDRADSATHSLVNEFCLGAWRPGLVVVPRGVWHGLQNLHHQPSTILVAVDRAYRYEDPDHWRVPHDSAEIPYRFAR